MTDGRPAPALMSVAVARSSWPWWIATMIYFVAGCLLHLQFSLWLVRPRDLPWGHHALSEFVPAAAFVGTLLLSIVVLHHLRHSPRPWGLGALWLLLAAAVWAIDRWLTYSANEYLHYPQYGLLAWLIARSLDPQREHRVPGRVLFWTTLLGAVDELLQYVWITTSYSHYFDFNDILVNCVAGGAGVLLYYGTAARAKSSSVSCFPRVLEASVIVALALTVGTALASGRLQVRPTAEIPPGGFAQDSRGRWTLYLQRSPGQHGSWQQGPHRGLHYMLRPLETLLALVLVGALTAAGIGGYASPVQATDGDDDDAAATMSRSNAAKSE